MPHVAFRLDNKITRHLNSFGVDEFKVVLHHHVLHEILMYKLSTRPPLLAVLHEQDMVATANDAVAHVRRRTMAVDVGLSIEQFSNQLWRSDDNRCAGADLERKDATVLFGP